MLVLKIKKPSSSEDISDIFSQLPTLKIGSVNWPLEFPYAPDVVFSLFHDGDNIYIKYNVVEQHTLARSAMDNGEIWKDSCVEFFVSFDDTGYYNIEFNSIGKGLVGFRQNRDSAIRASDEVLSLITRTGTLGSEPFEEKENQSWELTLTIPKEVFFNHNFTTLSGINARANFYKCGDDLTSVHFTSWKPINNPTPNFHLPNYFGNLEFV